VNGHHSDGYRVAANARTTREPMEAVSKMSQVWVLGDGGLVASYFGSTLQDREG